MYGGTDLLIVGQFASAADVSAVSTGSQVMQSVTSVITGLAMGTTILLGQKMGQKQEEEAGDVIGGSICLFAVVAAVTTLVMVAGAPALSRIMHAPEEAFDKTSSYVRICSAGSGFIIAYNVLGSVFRGIGDSKTPLLAVFIACVFNIVGDLFFVAVLGMASRGAALATVMAQGVSVILSLLIIRRRQLPFAFSRANIRFRKNLIRKILVLGFPIALQDFLVSVSFLVIIAIINGLGVIASAGVGVAEKLCTFILMMPSAFSQSMSAFVAQNFGAGKMDRAKRGMVCGMAVSFGFGLLLSYLSFFHGALLTGIFAKDSQIVLAGADYLRAYAIDTLLVSFLFCFTGYFNGCGRTAFVMIQGIMGAFCVRIPMSYFMSRQPGASLFQVGLAIPMSTVVQILVCVIYFARSQRQSAPTP
jgi:putative MATE family efflux protein